MISIIVPAYVQTELSAHITMACLHNIIKYTDPKEYELILIHDIPKFNVRDDFKIFQKIGLKEIILDKYTNYSTKMNLAAKQAQGEYLAFIQNDCFMFDGWLETVKYYFDNKLAEAIIPHQWPMTYEQVRQADVDSYEESMNKGSRDACAIMITREAFDKTGGFNEDLRAFVEADFYERMARTGINQITSSKLLCTHISLATHYQDPKRFDKSMLHDSLLRNK